MIGLKSVVKAEDFKNGDFILYPSEKQIYNGKIIDILGTKVKIEICVCAKDLKDPILEELIVNKDEIKKKHVSF